MSPFNANSGAEKNDFLSKVNLLNKSMLDARSTNISKKESVLKQKKAMTKLKQQFNVRHGSKVLFEVLPITVLAKKYTNEYCNLYFKNMEKKTLTHDDLMLLLNKKSIKLLNKMKPCEVVLTKLNIRQHQVHKRPSNKRKRVSGKFTMPKKEIEFICLSDDD